MQVDGSILLVLYTDMAFTESLGEDEGPTNTEIFAQHCS